MAGDFNPYESMSADRLLEVMTQEREDEQLAEAEDRRARLEQRRAAENHRPLREERDPASLWDEERDRSLERCPECGAQVQVPLERVMGRTRPSWVPDRARATLAHGHGCRLFGVGPDKIASHVMAARAREENDRKRAAEAHDLERRRVAAMERQAAALEALAAQRKGDGG